jgi:hypothetical protein
MTQKNRIVLTGLLRRPRHQHSRKRLSPPRSLASFFPWNRSKAATSKYKLISQLLTGPN